MSIRSRLWNLVISLDQFVFCLATLGAAAPDETISAAAWRMEKQGGKWFGRIARPAIDWLCAWAESDHCRKAYEDEVFKRQLPREYRDALPQANVPTVSQMGQS